MGLIQFRTAIEGVEVEAELDYLPAGEDERGKYDHDVDIRDVKVGGIDIYELCSEYVLNTIRRRFLDDIAGE